MPLGVLKQKQGSTTLTHLCSSKWQQGATLWQKLFKCNWQPNLICIIHMHYNTQHGKSAHSGRWWHLEKNIFSPENHFLWKLSNYNELLHPMSPFKVEPPLHFLKRWWFGLLICFNFCLIWFMLVSYTNAYSPAILWKKFYVLNSINIVMRSRK